MGFGSGRIHKENFTMLQNKKNSLVNPWYYIPEHTAQYFRINLLEIIITPQIFVVNSFITCKTF
jgi:hypothetical protein